MSTQPQLRFSIPIPPCGEHPGGAITCTEPQPAVYVLTWESPPENRITTPFLRALLTALDVIEYGDYKRGVVITTSAITKYYSNGADLEHAFNTDGFWQLFHDTWARFLTYPMPTLALINGHAFAGGIMLAMAHDYRLGPGSKGWICVNELQFDAPLMRPFTALFRQQIPLLHYRSVALEARRFTGEQAMEVSLVDGIAHTFDDALQFINDRDLLEKAKSQSYAQIKTEMYADLLADLTPKATDRATRKTVDEYTRAAERKERGRAWYKRWAAENKAKSKM